MIYENTLCSISMKNFLSGYFNPKEFSCYCSECPFYARYWSCPPFFFSQEALLEPFSYLHLWISKTTLNTSSSQSRASSLEYARFLFRELLYQQRVKLDSLLLRIERASVVSPVMAFFAGHCHWCRPGNCCRIQGLPCRYPHLLRPSLESLGCNLCQAVEDLAHIQIDWAKDASLPNSLTLVGAIASSASSLEGFSFLPLHTTYIYT